MSRQFTQHIAGKVAEKIVITEDDEVHEIEIRFADKTACHIEFGARMRLDLELVEVRNWKTGNCKLVQEVCLMFVLGRVLTTPGALEVMVANGIHPLTLLARHSKGDWGDVSEHDRLANERALNDGGRIWSVYKLRSGDTVWVITEAESEENQPRLRLSTCILLPEEY
jgi:hypothetical protein